MMVEEWGLYDLQKGVIVAPLLLAVAALMVSRVPFQSFKKFKTRWGMVLFYGNLVAGLLELAAGLPGGTHMFILLNVYVFLGVYGVLSGGNDAPVDEVAPA